MSEIERELIELKEQESKLYGKLRKKKIMKIFSFEWKSDVTDWIFASDKEDAIEFYLGLTGNHRSDLDECKITEIPKDMWSENYIVDPEKMEPSEFDDNVHYNEEDYHHGYKILETFADYAKRNTHRDIIATTEI